MRLYLFVSLFFIVVVVVFVTRLPCVVLAALEISLYTRLPSDSKIQLPPPPECWDLMCVTMLSLGDFVFKNKLQPGSDGAHL